MRKEPARVNGSGESSRSGRNNPHTNDDRQPNACNDILCRYISTIYDIAEENVATSRNNEENSVDRDHETVNSYCVAMDEDRLECGNTNTLESGHGEES